MSLRTLKFALGLWILLIGAQQGAFAHELMHLSTGERAGVHGDARAVSDAVCGQCPGFSQVVTPALSHSLFVPPWRRAPAERGAAPPFEPITAQVPKPRSRGPPATV
jgi:hypothetical protein